MCLGRKIGDKSQRSVGLSEERSCRPREGTERDSTTARCHQTEYNRLQVVDGPLDESRIDESLVILPRPRKLAKSLKLLRSL